MAYMKESEIESAALSWLANLGYQTVFGPDIAPDMPAAERKHYGQVVLESRLRDALAKLNPQVPANALEEAFRKLTRPDSPSLVGNNHVIHKYLVEGVPVEYQRDDGSIGGDLVRVFDYAEPGNNEFLAVNQFTVVENQHERRPDVVLFVNGLPLAVMELKNAATEDATIWTAFNQLQTYKTQIPSLFSFNEVMVISDGVQARIGTLTADREWFMPWRTIEGEELADNRLPQLRVVLEGVFEKRRFLDLIRHFIVFEDVGGGVLIKKMAGCHQYQAVNRALNSTVRAAGAGGDKRVGVVWHTQGSGKSLTMAFYAGRVVLHPKMENPTLVVITDRNDLDDQLYGTFARCHELLRQQPMQAQSRANLRELLTTASGGVIFTTVHKFFPTNGEDQHPLLSDRRNIVVIADEAHRSQYDFIDGFARHMREALPNALFIGFTGTPIELTDKNTRAVFGNYVSIYDIERAVEDGATVPIYYESRLAKLELKETERPKLDAEFEEATEGEEVEHKERLKTKWAQLEALVGTEKRLKLIAEDLVKHFEERLSAMDGKAMIVCMSRRICVDLYKAITAIRPHWHHDDDGAGILKIVMTGSASDPADWQAHIRNKPRREELAKRFRDPKEPFKVVIVRDMWLTGFDAPCLHTMYVDKPMRGHGLMQAIARVNRVFKDKPGGLVVDYLGLADQLKYALANYTKSGGKGQTAIGQEEAVAVMLEKYEVCCGIFHGFDWSSWKTGGAKARLSVLPAAQEHVLAQNDGKNRLVRAVGELSKAFALAVPHEKALEIRDDVAFFQAVKSVLTKSTGDGRRSPEEIEFAIRQIVSKAVSSDEVIDTFAAAGLKKPDISILSDEFLAEVRGMPQRNLAVEMLRKLLEGEIKARGRKNVVQARSFAELLENAIKKYQTRAIETAQVIEELIALAKDLREANQRGEKLGLTDDEVAFYDALEVNDSAVAVLGDETLRLIAQELVKAVRNSITIDWTVRETIRAQIRVIIKRILRKHGYPPDKQTHAADLVLEQAEVLCKNWTEKA
ncbi:type I restriction endonuclease subunit R [Chloracidobacterium thermophilum]|uniref:type I restriction endonuclease subunit R n=1 Tax=Chloracidobacterium thermophilum TaxID=458033 RepID=UPI000738A086|nr:type I restriction endonuclease subunit R [Chloracidobacterium thermophilum]